MKHNIFILLTFVLLSCADVMAHNEKTIATVQSEADRGNYSAMAFMSMCYMKGNGVKMDPDKAFEYARKSAEKKNGSGLFMLASCFATGTGIAKDYKKSQECLKLAENKILKEAKKDPYAMFMLGQFYMSNSGDIICHDMVKALECFTAAAEAGVPGALITVASLYLYDSEIGDGQLGVAIMEKLANEDNIDAMYNLKSVFKQGKTISNIDINPAKSVEWCRKLAEKGRALEIAEMGDNYLTGFGVQKNEEEAYIWYAKAQPLAQGKVLEYVNKKLADFDEQHHYYAGISDFSTSEAREIYKKAMDNDAAAQFVVAQNYIKSEGGATFDEKKAKEWLSKAAAAGNKEASQVYSTFDRNVEEYKEAAKMRAYSAKGLREIERIKREAVKEDRANRMWAIGDRYEEGGSLYVNFGIENAALEANLDSAAVWYEKSAKAYHRQKEYSSMLSSGIDECDIYRKTKKPEKLVATLKKYITMVSDDDNDAKETKGKLLKILCYCYYKGIDGMKKDYAMAAKYCKEAISVCKKDEQSKLLMALMMFNGRGVPINKAGSYQLFDENYDSSLYGNLIFRSEDFCYLFDDDEIKVDREEAYLDYGICWEMGYGVTPDIHNACVLWNKTLKGEALYKLGQYTEKGRWRPKTYFGRKYPDIDLAREYYREAINRGYQPAKAALKRLGY